VLSPAIHRYIFLFGICTLGGGMLLGTISTSVPQIILFGNWLLEGRFKERFLFLKNNRIFWALVSVFLLHCIGMAYTADTEFGWKDIRIKMPMLVLPLIFFTTKPLNKKELELLLWLFVTGIIISLVWCLYYSFTHVLPDIRKASRFISHIRLSLFICLGICTLFYFMFTKTDLSPRVISALLILFLFFCMMKFSLITGIALFGLIAAVVFIYILIKQNLIIKLIGFSLLSFGIMSGIWFLNNEWQANNFVEASPANTIKALSPSGRPYFKVTNTWQKENGYYVSYNIQYNELYSQWSHFSKRSVHGMDNKSNTLMWTLIRYMTSKGLTKDSAGLKQLNREDIQNIENGVTNYKYADAPALRKRAKDFIGEYQNYLHSANPSGNTLLMRFEFWKAARYIIERNLVFGVGTGDAPRAFEKAYYRTNTKLAYEWRLRSHNQFLAITVSFGLIGLLVFVISIFYPVIALRKKLHPLYFMFFIIAMISFLTEDTLESQAGVSFYAYFNTLFLWLASRSDEIVEDQNL
jgi:hypothetical protein